MINDDAQISGLTNWMGECHLLKCKRLEMLQVF